MAQVRFIGIVESATGKVCTHSDTSFVHRKKSGKTFTCRREYKSEKEPSTDQMKWRKEFGDRQKRVMMFINDLGAMKQDEIAEKAKASKYETVRSFIYAHVNWDTPNPHVIAGGLDFGVIPDVETDGIKG